MAKTCASCGAVSESGQGYQSTSFVHPKDWCPVCYPKVKSREAWWSLGALPVGMIIAGVLTHTRPPNNHVGWALLNFNLVLIAQGLSVFPHELGHALMARAVGWRVFKVVVGYGPLLFKTPLLGGTLEVHAHPWGGHTIPTPPDERALRFRRFLVYAGGPLVNALLVLAVLFWLPRPNPFKGMLTTWSPLQSFALANLVSVILGLLPWRYPTTIGVMDSDGLALLKTPFLPHDQIRKAAATHFLVEGMIQLEAKRLDEAVRWYTEGLEKYPESAGLRNDLGVALLRRRDYPRAREVLLPILSDEKAEPFFRGVTLNNVAYADLLLERADLVEEALRFSEEAMRLVGWNPPIRGTRAAALVVGGKLDEGLALAKEMLERNEEPEKKAFNAVVLALGHRRRGDLAEARRYLEMAERLGPEDHLLPLVRKELIAQ